MRKRVRARPYHRAMRSAYIALAGLMMLNVVYQFVTAGLVVFEGEDVDVHQMGANVAHLWPLLMAIVAAVGRFGARLIVIPVVLFVLVGLQYMTAEEIGAIHPLVALIIAFGAYHALVGARMREVS